MRTAHAHLPWRTTLHGVSDETVPLRSHTPTKLFRTTIISAQVPTLPGAEHRPPEACDGPFDVMAEADDRLLPRTPLVTLDEVGNPHPPSTYVFDI